MGKTLLQKVWDLHTVRQLPTGQTQLFIGLHLVHEVTSPQAFDTLRANGWKVPFTDRTFAGIEKRTLIRWSPRTPTAPDAGSKPAT